MDQSLWQTPESLDFIYSSHEWITNDIVMWVILPNNAGWDCFKTLTSRRCWGFRIYFGWNTAFFEVIHLFRWVGCVRNILLFRTVQQSQKSLPWMQDWGWMVFPHLIHVIWLFLFLETHFRPMIERRNPLFVVIRITCNLLECSMFCIVFQVDRGNLRVMNTNTTSLTIKLMWWKTLMLFLQMSNPRVKKLYCIC